MMRMLTAHTHEIDDIEAAVSEILAQLDLDNKALANSAGIITCYPDYLETGVVKALCDRLPFELVGCTTLGNATGDSMGMMMLSLTVLTSDELTFATVASGSLFDEQKSPIAEAYKAGLDALGRPPALLIPFLPLINHVGGELLLETLSDMAGDVPIFGTVACDQNLDYHQSHVIRNGEYFRDAMSLLLVAGNISPRFTLVSIPDAKVQKHHAIITESEGHLLRKVNDMPLLDYMQTLDLAEGGSIEGASAIPFVVDFGDGSRPAARAIYMVTEDHVAVCGGSMPVGATLAIGSIDFDDVLETTDDLLSEIRTGSQSQGALAFSCVSRNLVLGADLEAELDRYRTTLSSHIPYHVAYSGGEVCPVYTSAGKLVNRFHNFTAVACLF